MKINLGCGKKKKEGFINVDIISDADMYVDLESGCLPFDDDSVDEIEADQVFEHIRNFIPLMNEIHRVLKPGGRLRANMPLAGTVQAFQDPTHVRFFVPETFAYWAKDQTLHEENGTSYGIQPFSKVSVGIVQEWILIIEMFK